MPLISGKSTIFKPHEPPHIRDDVCVYLVENDEYEQIVDAVNSLSLTKRKMWTGFLIY